MSHVEIPRFENEQFADPIEHGVLTAVANSMQIVRDAQRQRTFQRAQAGDTYGPSVLKSDGSMLTPTDVRSEQAAQRIVETMLPGAGFKGEEGSQTEGTEAIRIGYDPLDGTRPFTIDSPASVVIATAYRQDGSVYGAALGEPATGKLYSAFGDQEPTGRLLDMDNGSIRTINRKTLQVSQDPLDGKGQVFLDNNQPFERRGREVLTAKQHMVLRLLLQQAGVGVMEIGSNGAHQMYMLGGERAAGSITTARGIQEDTSAGAFLIERAGGHVQRYDAGYGTIKPVETETPDYDMLLTANTGSNFDQLQDLIHMLTDPSKMNRAIQSLL